MKWFNTFSGVGLYIKYISGVPGFLRHENRREKWDIL